MPKLHPALLLLATALPGLGQQSITDVRVPVNQNFDAALGTSAAATLPTGWRRGEVWTSGDPILTQTAGTTGTGIVASGSNGGAYNWASGVTATATDRAPGFLSATLFTSPCYLGYAFTNNTGKTIRALDLSWNYEKYRSGTRAFSWSFEHGAAATALITGAAGAQSYPADANNITVYNPPASIAKAFRISGLSIAPGATYYLRWTYTGNGGSTNAQGLGLDDFSITPIVPVLDEPSAPSAFSSLYGSASSAQTLTIGGSDLDGPVTVTAPANFEVSADGLTYSSSIDLPVGAIPATVSLRLAATAPIGSTSGFVNLSSLHVDTQYLAISGTINPPYVATTGSLSAFSTLYGAASAVQTLTVTGGALTGPVEILAPAGMEISADGVTYSPTLSLATANLPATLRVRIAAGTLSGPLDGSITLTSPNVATVTVALSGEVIGPAVASSPSTLTGFNTVSGTPAAAQTFTVSASRLIGPVTVVASTGYEISADGTGYAASLTLASAALPQTLSVRLAATAEIGAQPGSVRLTSEGATSQTLTLTGAMRGVITPSVTQVTGLQAVTGAASSSTTFTVNGVLTGALSLQAPAGFEISLDGTNFARTQARGGGVAEIVGSAVPMNYQGAFAARMADGSVETWGASNFGGDSSTVADRLDSGVVSITNGHSSFAALKADGSVVTWGNASEADTSAVSDRLSSGVSSIYTCDYAYAALKADGSVVTWGQSTMGGDSSAVADRLASGVVNIVSNPSAFAALKSDGSVVTWGSSFSGGYSASVSGQLSSGVKAIYSNGMAFAAVKTNGSVVTWGSSGFGSDSSAVASQLSSGVTAIYGNPFGFAAVKADGSVVTWGYAPNGGDSSTVSNRIGSGVTTIASTNSAFAALKTDGSVVTWGDSLTGGDSNLVASRLNSGVASVHSNLTAFAALKVDGSVVTWGSTTFGGDSSAVASQLSSGVTSISNNKTGFAALKSDGSVCFWGQPFLPPSPPFSFPPVAVEFSAIASQVASGVISITSNESAFAAIKRDGTVVTWGAVPAGGNSSAVANKFVREALSLPLKVHVRMAATSTPGAVAGNLVLTSASADTKTVALSGTVTSETGNSPSAAWRLENFGTAENTGNAADLATPDGDGIANIVKYGLCIRPGTNGSSRLPALSRSPDGRLSLRFLRDPSRTDVNIIVEAQAALGAAWGSIARSEGGTSFTGTAESTETTNSDGTRTVEVKDSQPISATPKRFLRVRVESAEPQG